MTGWVDLPYLGFDTETTGVDYDTDLILSSSLVNVRDPNAPGPLVVTTDYLDHGLRDPIPAGHVHKLTADFLAQNGTDPATTLEAICLVMAAVIKPEQPLVGMNLVFDLTMLDRNCRRYGVLPLTERCEIYAVDAFVLDKQVEPYRKGKRNLEALAAIYRVPWDTDDAHTSAADAIAAARVVWRIGRLYPPVGALGAATLHSFQTAWKREQDESFAAYLLKQGKSADGLDGQWPVKPYAEPLPDPWADTPTAPAAGGELVDAPLW